MLRLDDETARGLLGLDAADGVEAGGDRRIGSAGRPVSGSEV